MRRRLKVALVVLLVGAATQAPFACRRYRLGRLHAAIQSLNAQRQPAPADDPFDDYAGVLHVHTNLGGHSTGTAEEVVRAAKVNALAFVVMTEHPSKYVDTAAATLRGTHEGVLFVGGSEVVSDAGERLLVFPGAPGPDTSPAQKLLDSAEQKGQLAFVAYPEQFRAWEARGFDGIEVYNLYTNTKQINYVLLAFDALWSYLSYPELLFATFYERPHDNLRKWDGLTSREPRTRLVALAGNDAHQNVGLSLEYASGRPLLRLRLDPYERSFRLVRTHALVRRGQTLDEATLLDTLARGHCYIAFDLFGDATGFRFTAESGAEQKIMGDEISLGGGGVRLRVTMPVKARVVFFRDGQAVREERETLKGELRVGERGAYRVEVYLDRLGPSFRGRPWIISNPIYVR